VATGSGPGRGLAASRARAGYPQPRRRRLLLLKGLLALVITAALVDLAMTPWIFHIGDRFTPLTMWDGYGSVQAGNGGRYLLFIHLQAGIRGRECGLFGCDTLHGTAKICTERGSVYPLALSGTVHAWWSTDGARTTIELQNVRSGPLPEGWVIALAGRWHGARLVAANPDNSFTEVLTPAGAIRQATSTADAGHASVTLRYGSSAAFSRACRALAA
jgi:hypothetical protein